MTVNFNDGSAPAQEQFATSPAPATTKKQKVHKGDILPVRMYALQCKAPSCNTNGSDRGKTVSTHWDRDDAFKAREEHFAYHKANA